MVRRVIPADLVFRHMWRKEMMKLLTPKQENFCAFYLKSGVASEAYKKAYGGGRDSARAKASALLRNDKIQNRLAELQAEIANEKILSAREVQERLSSIARRELTESVVLPSGEEVTRQTSIKDSIKALELLGKIQGMFIAKQEVDVNVLPVVIRDDL